MLLHDECQAQHGGVAGVRDRGALERVLAQLRSIRGDLVDCAAARITHLLRVRPFLGGHLRAALLDADLFLRLNGHVLVAPPARLAAVMQAMAATEIGEPELACWMRDHVQHRDS
jgi:death-on-curing protein